APVLIPSISSCLFFDGVTETVVPGHTRTSPPRERCSTAVSEPAITEDPAAMRRPASRTDPWPAVTGTKAGAGVIARDGAERGWNGDFPAAFTSSGGLRRTIKRLPAPSHV